MTMLLTWRKFRMLCADISSIPQFSIICSLTYIIINIASDVLFVCCSLLFMYYSLMFSVPPLMASVIRSKLSIPSSMCFCTTTLYIISMSGSSCSLIFIIPVRSIKIYIKSISSLYLIFPFLLLSQ
jgi:hypothetical protein